jgi:hypothetical protein
MGSDIQASISFEDRGPIFSKTVASHLFVFLIQPTGSRKPRIHMARGRIAAFG